MLGPSEASITGALLGDWSSSLADVSLLKNQRNETMSPSNQPFQGVSLLPGRENWSMAREGTSRTFSQDGNVIKRRFYESLFFLLY